MSRKIAGEAGLAIRGFADRRCGIGAGLSGVDGIPPLRDMIPPLRDMMKDAGFLGGSAVPREGKVYYAVVLDAFSRRVVGWSISHNPTGALTSNALGMAIEQREAQRGETIIHSDHGAQFTSWAFTERARASGLVPSMGSVGDCYDCDDRSVLVADAGRATQHAPLADARRTRRVSAC
jgi:Integrase core domain